jgi:hypothetical protein
MGHFVHFRGRLAAKRLVGTNVVELLAPAVEQALLLCERLCRLGLHLGADVSMHALMAAVVLGAAWA